MVLREMEMDQTHRAIRVPVWVSELRGLVVIAFRMEGGMEEENLRLGQTCIKPDAKVRLQLGIDSLNSGQGRNNCNLSALEIQVVASEDVSEQVSFQKLINGWDECNVPPG
jgi:hypothetical protein